MVILGERAVQLGMIARSDRERMWERHVLDSLRGSPLVPTTARVAYDLGSGAGLPGIPIAIARPDLKVVLAESRRPRAAFLELVVEQLDLANVEVHAAPVSDLASGADACLARAFADGYNCWRIASSLLAEDGILLYWAGRGSTPKPPGAETESFSTPGLANAGPVVIMRRR